MSNKYSKYEEVPWYRKSGLNSLLALIGVLLFPPFLWWCCINLVTGGVYYNKYDRQGNLKQWSQANKVVAGIILLLQLFGLFALFINR